MGPIEEGKVKKGTRRGDRIFHRVVGRGVIGGEGQINETPRESRLDGD